MTFTLSQRGPDQPAVPCSVYLPPATRQHPHLPLPVNSLWIPTHRMQPARCPAWPTRCSALPCPPAQSPALPPAGPAQGPQILFPLLQDGPVVRPVLVTRTLTGGLYALLLHVWGPGAPRGKEAPEKGARLAS